MGATSAVRAVCPRCVGGGAGQRLYPQPLVAAGGVGLQRNAISPAGAGELGIFFAVAASQRLCLSVVWAVPSVGEPSTAFPQRGRTPVKGTRRT